MAGSTKPADLLGCGLLVSALAIGAGWLASPAAAASAGEGSDKPLRADPLPPGLSPGERAAVAALCGASRGEAAQSMCRANQLEEIERLGRKPDLSVANPAQRRSIAEICASKSSVGVQFACERSQLIADGLPTRDEPGGTALTHGYTSRGKAGGASATAFPFFSLVKWRSERPAMPRPYRGPRLPRTALYDLIAPSIYVVLASDHAIELAERVPHAQGGAVAITGSILLTNCHVIDGRPQISLSQHGRVSRAHLIYADPGGDRCFLRSDMPVHPVAGIRPFDDLKIGEPVFSCGAPSGLEASLGAGAITGFRRLEGVHVIANSAPTSYGSSGGGLFDAEGNLVGVTTAISTTIPNTGFSIAAEDFWP